MENKKTNEAAAAVGQAVANRPVKTFRIGDVSASVFARKRHVDGEEQTFHSVSFSRSYIDDSGKRRYVKAFDSGDLGPVASVAEHAAEYLRGLNA